MPDKIVADAGKLIDFLTALAYAVIAVSGASGGCLVAAQRALRGRNVTVMLVFAYAFVGMVFAVAGMAAISLVTLFEVDFGKLVLIGLILGVSGSVALAGANLSIRFFLRRLGVEVDVSVHRINDK